MMIISFLVKKAMDFPLLLCRAQGTGLRQKKQTGLLRARTAAEKKRTFLLAAICYTEGKKEGRAMSIAGLLIRRERLARAWSQEGLCRGICGTSYLSKIEQGKAAASEEILTLLLARLGLSWTNDEDGALRARTEACMEALFSGDASAFDAAFARLRAQESTLLCSPCAADYLLLRAFSCKKDGERHPLCRLGPARTRARRRRRRLLPRGRQDDRRHRRIRRG